MMRLGYRAFAVGTLVAGVVFIEIVPTAVDTWSFLKNNVGFLRPDPEEMD
jgi:hypothetical protein